MNLKNKLFIFSILVIVQMFSGCNTGLKIPGLKSSTSVQSSQSTQKNQSVSMNTQGSVINANGGLKLSDEHNPDPEFSTDYKPEFSD